MLNDIGQFLLLRCSYGFGSLVINGCPLIAFSNAVQHPERIHIVKVTAGQWFWRLKMVGTGDNNTNPLVVLRQVGGVLDLYLDNTLNIVGHIHLVCLADGKCIVWFGYDSPSYPRILQKRTLEILLGLFTSD